MKKDSRTKLKNKERFLEQRIERSKSREKVLKQLLERIPIGITKLQDVEDKLDKLPKGDEINAAKTLATTARKQAVKVKRNIEDAKSDGYGLPTRKPFDELKTNISVLQGQISLIGQKEDVKESMREINDVEQTVREIEGLGRIHTL